jgi:DNA-binding transcriptional ArsR family regulator
MPFMSNVRVRLFKKSQIEQRRAAVFELAAQGLSPHAISERLSAFQISQRTVNRDLEYLRKESIKHIKRSRENLAHEYRISLSNFYQLRKEAWNHFHTTKNESIKASLYNTIQSINNDIMNMLAISDVIKVEVMLQEAKEKAENTREGMNNIIGNESERQAVF